MSVCPSVSQCVRVRMMDKKDVDNIREARDQDKKEVLTLISHCLAAHQVNPTNVLILIY